MRIFRQDWDAVVGPKEPWGWVLDTGLGFQPGGPEGPEGPFQPLGLDVSVLCQD